MKQESTKVLNSISQLHNLLKLAKPTHPLVSVINVADVDASKIEITEPIVFNFYVVNFKQKCEGKLKYGQQYYDFDEGVMTFVSPKQRVEVVDTGNRKFEGYMIIIHPDFLYSYSVSKKIKEYGYFSYAVNEALHLSASEEKIIIDLLQNLSKEINANIDNFTQDVVVAQLELFFNYCNRFYNRQFITRKKISNDLITKFDDLLVEYFMTEKHTLQGLPTVQYFSEKLFVSSNYLNDMLKQLTGQTTQQHIQSQLIEKAKELLSTTDLSVSEIAYHLGFEFPQSFNKLFKNKTELTPLQFRQSFN